MRIDLEKLKEVFRTAKGRRIILAIPIAVFLLMLALTGDFRSAMHAAKLAG